jgi:uncharacterized protein (UPF0548 family)
MWSVRKPSGAGLQAFLETQRKVGYSYADVGATAKGYRPPRFDHDMNRVLLGQGDAEYEKACTALREWRHFQTSWTQIFPAAAAIQNDTTILVIIRALGVHWWNSARIVYTVDEQLPLRRFGFAYGTLWGHAECGEERFTVEIDSDRNVWYAIESFSRPRILPARIAYPITRALQRKFIRDSNAAMLCAMTAN